jgi:hypothetical protein
VISGTIFATTKNEFGLFTSVSCYYITIGEYLLRLMHQRRYYDIQELYMRRQMQVSLQLTKAINSLRNIAILKKITICWKVYLCFGYTYSALQHVWTVWVTCKIYLMNSSNLRHSFTSRSLCEMTWVLYLFGAAQQADDSFFEEINVRENRRGNQEWTIQRHWQHWSISHKERDVNECLKFEEFIKYILLSN